MSTGHQGKYAVSDLEYSVVVTLSNLLQGCEALPKYQADAEKAGDSETAEIFRKAHESYDGLAAEFNAALRRIATNG